MDTAVAPKSSDCDNKPTNHVSDFNTNFNETDITTAETADTTDESPIETVEIDVPTARVQDDDLFDSDEQVDVESISSSDDDDNSESDHPSVLPQCADPIPPKQYLGKPLPRSKTHTQPSTTAQKQRSSETASTSLFLRASQTFYKTFIKRKSVSAERPATTCPRDTNDDQNERLCRLLDAQLSALAGAQTGFVQLELLRPLAEETLRAVTVDARNVLTDFGVLEMRADSLRKEVLDAMARGEEEIFRKERLLIETKVALAEACGEVERLRGELASVKRTLADPTRRQMGRFKLSEKLRLDADACQVARADLEQELAAQKICLAKDMQELSRVEKEFRDIEGDWA